MSAKAIAKLLPTTSHPSIIHCGLESRLSVKGKILYLKNGSPLRGLQGLTQKGAAHVIPDDTPYSEVELASSLLMLETPQSFFDNSLHGILLPGAPIATALDKFSVSFNDSRQKREVISGVLKFASGYRLPQSSIENIQLAVDELFTNALYNAPFVRSGCRVDRSRDVSLEHGFGATMTIGVSGDRMALVCEDPYGSLQIPLLLKRMCSCYEVGAGEMINWGRGGAGIGSYLIMENCISLYYAVKESRKTVVAGVFAFGKGPLRRSKAPKCLHTLFVPAKDTP